MYRIRFLTFVLIAISLPVHSDHLDFADVYPILEQRCLVCHHHPGAPLGLSMETYQQLLKGSENGVIVIVGEPENSELMRRIKGDAHPRMPFNGPPYLTELEIELIENWIDSGLKP
ncbi:MAG: hypothetical protein H8E21_16685 [Gammaproteobacteria bacterium]|nr:hypothetical protein [Gammaproteobacteria bacterium]